MKKILIYLILGASMMAIMAPAASQEINTPVISLMIDIDTPPSPNYDEIRSAEANFQTISSQIAKRDGNATFLLTREVAKSRIRLLLAQYSVLSSSEFAISGNQSVDKLSTMPLSDQESLIKNSIKAAEAARVCGKSQVNVLGFMPPGFDQNEDTYKAIDNLEIQHNMGFQAGIINAPGHEEDVWPYQVEGYNFYAVPVSSVSLDDKLLPLYDKKMSEEGISASKWAEILSAKLDASVDKNEPVVVMLSSSISGSGEYLDALKQFLDYAVSKNASFVTAKDLIVMAHPNSIDLGNASVCTTCGEDEILDVEITQIETPMESNESAENATVEA